MAEPEDVNTLKRRGRRRLVGAIALVLAAVIVLPMIFDSEPRQAQPPVSVRIPAEEETSFTPKVTPKSPVTEPPRASAAPAKPEPGSQQKPAAKAPEKPRAEPAKAAEEAERKRAEAALAGREEFYVQVGAYAEPEPVLEKLKAAKLPFYTETVAIKQGSVTRVRAGPFSSREAAEKAFEQLKGLGFKPGSVAARSG